ncbi:MAG: peptidylprolyl isomerase [Clostridia bacterium]|nr:peptidylprolyl isomerase [Clostridia bacterium]
MKKTLKKLGCAALAACSLAVGAFAFTGCTTDRPELEIQLSFNGETYTLEYTLYRKYAPNTVNHFLALAENGYYDGLCVHDYVAGDKMQLGAYSYDETQEENGGLVYKPYFDTVKTYQDFPVSVWADKAKTTPTYTVYGEFKNNEFTVEKGDFLRQEFGALTMIYNANIPVDSAEVWVQRVDGNGVSRKDYVNNSATSRFTISLRSTVDYNYCTFAMLDDDSVSTLKSLKSALEEHASEYDESNAFTQTKELEVGEDDVLLDNEKVLKETYRIPSVPIVIEYVKVNKY